MAQAMGEYVVARPSKRAFLLSRLQVPRLNASVYLEPFYFKASAKASFRSGFAVIFASIALEGSLSGNGRSDSGGSLHHIPGRAEAVGGDFRRRPIAGRQLPCQGLDMAIAPLGKSRPHFITRRDR